MEHTMASATTLGRLTIEGHISVNVKGGEPLGIASFEIPLNLAGSVDQSAHDGVTGVHLSADTIGLKADIGRALLEVADQLLAP
jgi:hypothetical protein